MRSVVVRWRATGKPGLRIDNVESVVFSTGFISITMSDGNTIHYRADKVDEIFEGELPQETTVVPQPKIEVVGSEELPN